MATGRTLRRLGVGRGRGRRLAVGFNVFGLADLIDAATLGVLLGLGLFAVEPTTEILAFLPLALVPTVAVPVAITLHIVSLRQLRAGARGKDQRTSMTIPPGEPTTGARCAGVALATGADSPGTRPDAALGAVMSYHDVQPPDLLPILSPGRHRSPRTGACFMELASLLAGERWSDHPACTHPLLAALARHVNDHTTDAGRQRLVDLVPSVIGLTGQDLHIDARIALGSATMALPVVAAGRQRLLAVSVLTCDRILAELDGRAVGALEEQSRLALADVPEAAGWADRFTSGVRPSAKGFRRQAAPTIVQDAVEGIAQACVPDPDGMLHGLLVQAIDVCAAWVSRDRITLGWSITACR